MYCGKVLPVQQRNETSVLKSHAPVLSADGCSRGCAERSLVTVWSAPNYCYRCGNVASILCFDENLEREVKYFTETEENSTTMAPRSNVSYFL